MTKKTISKEDVKNIGNLAWIRLSEKEIQKFQEQLTGIIDYVDLLNELDTKEVNPTFQVTGLKNVMREDVIKRSLSQEDALLNAPEKMDGYFKVKKVL